MKFFSLLPIGAALVMAIPLAAQTSSVGAPPAPQTPSSSSAAVGHSKTVERKQSVDTLHRAPEAKEVRIYKRRVERTESGMPTPPDVPTPPDAPMVPDVPMVPNVPMMPAVPVPSDAPDAPEAMEIFEDVVIETPMPLEGAERNEIFIESPEVLREVEIDSVGNQLRIRIKESAKESRELRRELEKLSRDLRHKNREFKELRMLMSKDTAGLQKALDEARKALDSAHLSVLQLDTNIVHIRSLGRMPHGVADAEALRELTSHHMAIVMSNDSNTTDIRWMTTPPNGSFGQHFSYQMISDSIGGHGKRVIVMDHMMNGNDDSVAGVPWMPTADRMAFYKSYGKAPHGFFMQHSGDSGCHAQVLCFRTFGDSVPGCPKLDLKNDGRLFAVVNNNIVIGTDSLRIVDGEDQQMVIRVDHGSSSDGSTRVLIITMSRTRNGREAETRERQPEELMKSNVPATATGYTLEANTPNPFSESTTINFTTPKTDHATLTVFDANGATVKVLVDEELPAGKHTVNFDVNDLASGVYFYRLVSGSFSETKTMTVAK